jgi:hypothetical protein
MPLIHCPDCNTEVSDRAPACVKCGAPLHAAAAIPPVTVRLEPKPKKVKWWLWVPLGIFAAVLAFGFSIPEYKSQAMAERRACEEFVKRGMASQYQCDSNYSQAIARGAK